MGADTKIEWAHHTFNPWIGCQKVSPGCTHCYAEVNTFTRAQRGQGRELWGPTAARHVVSEAKWREPEKWNRAATGSRARVFCASMADVFEDRDELKAPRRRLFDLILRTPSLDWLLLTKRPENIPKLAMYEALARCWLGVSVEDQERADQRVPLLLQTPAAVRWVSYEPALGPVDFNAIPRVGEGTKATALKGWRVDLMQRKPVVDRARLDWIVVGGESGPGARPFDLAWARRTIEQCRGAGVPVFCKQLGAFPVEEREVGTAKGGCHVPLRLRDRKGGDPSEWPADLRVREFPQVLA